MERSRDLPGRDAWAVVGLCAGIAASIASELGQATATDVRTLGEYSPDWLRLPVLLVGLSVALVCAYAVTARARGWKQARFLPVVIALGIALAGAGILLIAFGPKSREY